MQDNAAVQRLLKAIGSTAMAHVQDARVVTFDDPCESIGAMAKAYEDFTRMHVTFGSPAAFDKLAAQYHVTIRWNGGCGRATHVAGTNGDTMPCGAKLTMLGVTAPYYCAKCEPGPGAHKPKLPDTQDIADVESGMHVEDVADVAEEDGDGA